MLGLRRQVRHLGCMGLESRSHRTNSPSLYTLPECRKTKCEACLCLASRAFCWNLAGRRRFARTRWGFATGYTSPDRTIVRAALKRTVRGVWCGSCHGCFAAQRTNVFWKIRVQGANSGRTVVVPTDHCRQPFMHKYRTRSGAETRCPKALLEIEGKAAPLVAMTLHPYPRRMFPHFHGCCRHSHA